MAHDLSDMLARYETEMTFQCNRGCTKRATRVVTVHRVDTCTEPDMPPTGDRTYLLCTGHAVDVYNRVLEMVKDMFETLVPEANWLECTSCGRVIHAYTDVLRIEPFRGAA